MMAHLTLVWQERNVDLLQRLDFAGTRRLAQIVKQFLRANYPLRMHIYDKWDYICPLVGKCMSVYMCV